MGYYIVHTGGQFRIRAHNKEAALLALKDLVKKNEMDWVDTDAVLAYTTLEEALTECRWEPSEPVDADIDITELSFTGEKAGSDFEIFKAIAPYVVKGSYIEMRGEEGELWRFVFDGMECKEIQAKITWEED